MKIIISIVILVILVAAGVFLKTQKDAVANLEAASLPHYSVKTLSSSVKTVQESRQFLAQLLASKSAHIASKFSAEIKHIYVHENDLVNKGQLLIALDDTDIQTTISATKKQQGAIKLDVSNALSTLKRNKKLLAAGAISQAAYDDSRALYQNKNSSLVANSEKIKQLKAQLQYLNIKAPFDGKIGAILVDAGNLAVPGRAIISLNARSQKLIFNYAQTSQAIIQGQKVLINGKEVGKVSRLYDDANNAMLVAEVGLHTSINYVNKGYVSIEVVTAELQGCSVPLSALLHTKDSVSLMQFSEDTFTPLSVEVVIEDQENAIVSPCPTFDVAIASEAKLTLLPSLGAVQLTQEH